MKFERTAVNRVLFYIGDQHVCELLTSISTFKNIIFRVKECEPYYNPKAGHPAVDLVDLNEAKPMIGLSSEATLKIYFGVTQGDVAKYTEEILTK